MEGRLAHHQHQRPALLQGDVGGAGDQVGGHAGGDLGHGADRAGRDDHAERPERTGRHRRAHVAHGVGGRRPRGQRRRREAGLLLQGEGGRAAHHQVALHLQLGQGLQHAHAVDHAGGSGDAHHQAVWLRFRHLRPPRTSATHCDMTATTDGA